MVFSITLCRFLETKMVIWKEREHELDDAQAVNNPNTILSLRECALLKLFRIPGMRTHVHLLEHLIRMWDPEQQHFQVGTHILTLDVEDIYFLTEISGKENRCHSMDREEET